MDAIDTRSTLPPPPACRHLGLADNPFQHDEASSDEHRCYLWMQRDRIDLDHQNGYCLSGGFRDCPWLHISVPGGPKVSAAWAEPIARGALAAGHRLRLTVAIMAAATAAGAWDAFKSMCVWSGRNLPRLARWQWRGILWLARSTTKALAATRRSAITKWNERRLRTRSRAAPEAPAGSDDLETLLRLGREASLAGQRKQACLFFSRATSLDPKSEQAWLWLAASTENPDDAVACLEKALAINPASGRARAQVADITVPAAGPIPKSRRSGRTVSTAPKLVQKGIAALDAGNEDEAYLLFSEATEADKDNESAWFWRAKTATDLAIVISCLERVLEINPKNQKAAASLDWAMERRRSSLNRTRAQAEPRSKPVMPSLYTKRSHAAPEPFLFQVSSAAYMGMGALWVGAAVLPALDGQLASLYLTFRFLPVLELPYIPSSVLASLFVTNNSLPEFNLLYLVPVLLGALSFVATEVVWRGKEAASLYLSTVAAVSVMAIGVLGTGHTAVISLTILSAVAGLSTLGGRIDWRRRERTLASRS